MKEYEYFIKTMDPEKVEDLASDSAVFCFQQLIITKIKYPPFGLFRKRMVEGRGVRDRKGTLLEHRSKNGALI